jgi:hypothetical protein
MDTTNATVIGWMFYNCVNLVEVPDMQTGHIRWLTGMFYGCSALTDGNVRLIGKSSVADTNLMISGSGLTRLPFYDTAGSPILQ